MVMPVKHWAVETLSAFGMCTWKHSFPWEKNELLLQKGPCLREHPSAEEGSVVASKATETDMMTQEAGNYHAKTCSQLTAKLGFCCKIFPKALH